MRSKTYPPRERNDPAQYDDLAASWWDPYGPLAMLQWIAQARASLVPPASHEGALLIDLGCGAGLLAPHLSGKGYTHVGVDLSELALRQAASHGVLPIRADVSAVPLPDAVADVVSAGEILEHVTDLRGAVIEACRLLRPGGTLVIDTIARTWLARLVAVRIAEHVPGGAPRGIHDSRLFVDRRALVAICAEQEVTVELNGLRPSIPGMVGHWLHRRPMVSMLRTRSTAILFQAKGSKAH